jgi:2-hydroxy-3-keto-5-methylthiopentenyl-1-phosphate phosphatase
MQRLKFNKNKIVATIWPASSSEENIEKIIGKLLDSNWIHKEPIQENFVVFDIHDEFNIFKYDAESYFTMLKDTVISEVKLLDDRWEEHNQRFQDLMKTFQVGQ